MLTLGLEEQTCTCLHVEFGLLCRAADGSSHHQESTGIVSEPLELLELQWEFSGGTGGRDGKEEGPGKEEERMEDKRLCRRMVAAQCISCTGVIPVQTQGCIWTV